MPIDLAERAASADERRKHALRVDLLTPVAKSFPAEKGFESNALVVQIHGGYGYSSEYLPEAWLRDQKLHSIHEGTRRIQGLDLLGRKLLAHEGEGLRLFAAEVERALGDAREAGVAEVRVLELGGALAAIVGLARTLAAEPDAAVLGAAPASPVVVAHGTRGRRPCKRGPRARRREGG